MAKPEVKPPKLVKIMSFYKEANAYGIKELEIDQAILDKHAKVIDAPMADVFAVCVNAIIKKSRDIFEI